MIPPGGRGGRGRHEVRSTSIVLWHEGNAILQHDPEGHARMVMARTTASVAQQARSCAETG